MLRFMAALFALLTLAGCSGCSGSAIHTEAKVATAIALVANTGLDVLGKVYEEQLVAAILAAGDATYAAEADRNAAIDRAEAAVIARWAPVWGDPPEVLGGRLGAWTVFRAAHTAWAAAIESGAGGATLRAQMESAYCALVAALPADAAALVRVPGVECSTPDAGAAALPMAPAVLPTVVTDAGVHR